MTASLAAPIPPESSNGRHHPRHSGQPISLATRHLCAVTHLRNSLLTDESFEADPEEPPQRQRVGRAYALSVLIDRQRTGPMPGVDLAKVKHECHRAIRQTIVRDAVAIALVVAAATLAPWGTFLLAALIAAVIALAGRVRVSPPLVIAAATGVVLALLSGGPHGSDPFIDPLGALLLCFLVYVADSFWAGRRVRAVMTQQARAPAAVNDTLDLDEAVSVNDIYSLITGAQNDQNARAPRKQHEVFYDKEGFLGAGTPLPPSTFTISLDKPKEDGDIKPFKASDLLEYVAAHVESQGTAGRSSGGFAHRRTFIDQKWEALNIPGPVSNGNRASGAASNHNDHEAFTEGLPELEVCEVTATPAPRTVYRPLWWLVATQLTSRTFRGLTHRLEANGGWLRKDVTSAFPARRYVRASTPTWDGELVVSIYVGATLQAHYLRLIVRPYLLAPMVPDLRQIEFMIARNMFMQLAMATIGTARSLFRTALAIHDPGIRRRARKASDNPRPRLQSTRERYAMDDTNSVHDAEDARRVFQVMSMKVFDATERYLIKHNIDTEEYMSQIKVFIQRGIVVTGGTISGNIALGDNSSQQHGPAGNQSGENNNGK